MALGDGGHGGRRPLRWALVGVAVAGVGGRWRALVDVGGRWWASWVGGRWWAVVDSDGDGG